jgi:predicted transcriptional regulator
MGSAKKVVLDLVKKLPEDSTFEDIQYQVYVRQKIQRSLEAAEQGRTKSHDEVKKRLAKWRAR